MRRHSHRVGSARIDPGQMIGLPEVPQGIDELVLLANVMNTQTSPRIDDLTVGFVGQQIPVRTLE